MAFDRESSIIAQNAGSTAAAIMGKYDPNEWQDVEEYLNTYDTVRSHVFNGTLGFAGAESVVAAFEGESSASAQRSSSPYQGGSTGRPSGGGGSLASLEVRSGKHAGKTLADIQAEDPGWLDWASKELKNDFLRKKVQEFLAA